MFWKSFSNRFIKLTDREVKESGLEVAGWRWRVRGGLGREGVEGGAIYGAR